MNRIVCVAFLLLTSVPAAFAATDLPNASVQDQNKALARRVFDQIFNQGKFQGADEIYAHDFVNHGLHKDFSLEEDQAAARWEKQTVPDMTITADLMMAEGDLVTVVWTARGTNTRPISGFPATGVKIEERGITVWRVVDGKIREEWTTFDTFSIARQVVSQLRWMLLGVVCAAVILVWIAGRTVRGLRTALSGG